MPLPAALEGLGSRAEGTQEAWLFAATDKAESITALDFLFPLRFYWWFSSTNKSSTGLLCFIEIFFRFFDVVLEMYHCMAWTRKRTSNHFSESISSRISKCLPASQTCCGDQIMPIKFFRNLSPEISNCMQRDQTRGGAQTGTGLQAGSWEQLS